MIKAKKKKLIILTSTVSSTVLFGAIVGTSAYLVNKDSNVRQETLNYERGINPIIAKDLNEKELSNIDVQKEKEKQFVEVILDFIDVFDNKSIKKVTLQVDKEDLEKFNLTPQIPEDYVLAGSDEGKNPGAFKLEEGLNTIYVKEKPVHLETTLVFTLDKKEKPEWTKIIVSTSKRDVIKVEDNLPSGYRLKTSDEKPVVNLGQRNVFEVEKIIKEFSTTINFVTKDRKTVKTISIKTFDDQKISLDERIPEGYILVGNLEVKVGETNNIQVSEIVTTIKYNLNGETLETKTVKSKKITDTIDANSFVPQGYHLLEPEKGTKLKVNQEYSFDIAKDQVKHETTLIFKDSENNKEFKVGPIVTFDDQIVPVQSNMPSGYRFAKDYQFNQNQIQLDKENIIPIEKIKTTVTFKDQNDGNKIIKTDAIDYKEKYQPVKIETLLPEGYKFVNQEDGNKLVEQGNQYEIFVQPIIKKVTTTLKFMNGNQVVDTITLITDENQKINVEESFSKSQYAKDYVLEESEKNKEVKLGEENTFKVVKKVVEKPQPKPTPEPEVTPMPEPEKENQNRPVEDPTKDIESQVNHAISVKGRDVSPNENANLDFALLKPDPQPSSSKGVSSKVRGVVDAALSNLSNLLKNLPPTLTQEHIQKFVKNFKDIYELQVDINGTPQKLNESLAEDLIKYMAEHPDKKDWFLLTLNMAESEKQKYYEKGMVPAFGVWPSEIGGLRYTYVNIKDNYVVQHMIKQNESRVLSSSRAEQRTPYQLRNDEYYGWNKFNTTQRYEKYGASAYDGITVSSYYPSDDNKFAKDQKKSEMNIITLDASNQRGYTKFLNVLNKMISEGVKINGITIKNIGKGSFSADFTNLLKKLPAHIELLSLYLQDYDATSLIGLKDKIIDELSISTSLNPLSDKWAMDPLSFGGVKHYSFDYVNNNSGYDRTEEIPGSIIFNTLKFSSSSSKTDIQKGFKLVFDTKKQFRLYQGAFGDGSWPTNLDFSLVSNVKSLEGFPLYGRVFKLLTLNAKLGDRVFEVDLKNLNKQQWKALIVAGPEKAQMDFKTTTGKLVDINTYYIKGNVSDFGQDWNQELYGLFQASKNFLRTIYVDNEAVARVIRSSQAYGQLNGATIQVKPEDYNTSSGSGVKFD